MSISACFLLSPFAAHAAAQTHDYDTKDTHTTHRSPSPLLQHPDRNGSTSADAIAPRTSLNGLAGRIRAPFPQARVALAIADEAWQYIYSPPFRGKRRGANPGPQSTFLPTRIMRSIPSVSPVHQHDKPHSWARLTAGNHAAFRTERRSSPKAETEGKNGASFACADSTFEEGGIRHVRALLLRYLVGGGSRRRGCGVFGVEPPLFRPTTRTMDVRELARKMADYQAVQGLGYRWDRWVLVPQCGD